MGMWRSWVGQGRHTGAWRPVTTTPPCPAEECQERAGKDYAAYFFLAYKEEKPYCITRCMPGFNSSLDCNFGKCQLERSGPRCL